MIPDAQLPGFVPASQILPKNLNREEELEEQVRQDATEKERLRELLSRAKIAQPAGIKPQEWQALQIVINDLLEAKRELQATVRRQTLQIEELQKANKDLQQEVYDVHEMARTIISDVAKRVTAIEDKGKPKETDNNKDHLNRLAQELLLRAKSGQKGVTYKEAAKILNINKVRVCQLRTLIASDSRFDVSWHPNRKNTKIICLKNYKLKEIVKLNV